MADYRRRLLLVEEVPGLYIRRLTLEDPRIGRDRIYSRSPSPVRHICHPKSGQIRPGRGSSSSYSYWFEKIKNNERPAYLTITSLELPESPIPLIESQASARLRSSGSTGVSSDKDEAYNDFFESIADEKKIYKTRRESVEKIIQKTQKQYSSKFNNSQFHKINKFNNSTKNNNNGRHGELFANQNDIITSTNIKDCICSEISENMEINIREKTEIKQSSRSPSPEVTHTIKIAMKYIGQPGLAYSDNKNTKINYDESSISCVDNNQNNYQEFGKKNNECCGVNVALDFTLNCNNFQLTQRDVSLKAMSKN